MSNLSQFRRTRKNPPRLGFPPDFPPDFAVMVHRLAASDSAGYQVDPVVFEWKRPSGELARVHWMPAAQFDTVTGGVA